MEIHLYSSATYKVLQIPWLKNISLEYNDSFSGEEEGVIMYSYQEKRDSLVVLNNLYFESDKLKGISIDFTSLQIQNENTFLTKIRDGITSCLPTKSNIYNVDTSSNNVNLLESASSKIFHLKIYERTMRKKIPFVF